MTLGDVETYLLWCASAGLRAVNLAPDDHDSLVFACY